MGQESNSSLVRWYQLSVCHEVSIMLSVRAAVTWGLMAEGCASKLIPMVIGRHVLLHMGLSKGFLSVPTTWQPAYSRVSDPRRRKREPETEHQNFITVSEVTHRHILHILLVIQTNPSTSWEGTIPGFENQEAGITGGHLESYMSYFDFKYLIYLPLQPARLFPQFNISGSNLLQLTQP